MKINRMIWIALSQAGQLSRHYGLKLFELPAV